MASFERIVIYGNHGLGKTHLLHAIAAAGQNSEMLCGRDKTDQ